MPSIPMGPGRRVAPRAATPTATGEAIGADTGRAMQQFGQAAFNVGLTDIELDARQRAVEEQKLRQQRESADKAAGIAALGTAKIQMREGVAGVAQRILSGELDDINARSEWDSIRTRVIEDVTRDLPGHIKETVSGAAKQQAAELASIELGNASRTRLRDVTRANLLTSLEGYERDAIDNRPKALQMAASALQKLGPDAGMGQDDQFRALQGLRERTAYNEGDRLLLAAGRSIPALDQVQDRINSDDFADLSPERRQTLEVRIANRRQSILHEQEVARNRAEAAHERRVKDAERAYEAAQSVFDGGAVLDDESAAATERAVAGTPYAAAFKNLVETGAQRANFGALTPRRQEELLIRMRVHVSENGASPERMERLNKYEAIAQRTQKQVNEDALEWGVRTRLLQEHVPIDASSIPALVQSLGDRISQAKLVSARLGAPVSPLFAHEAPELAKLLGGMPAAQRASAIQALASVMPEAQGQALARQMAKQDLPTALAFGLSTDRTTEGRPTGELVLKGAEALKNKTVKADEAAEMGWTASIWDHLGKIRMAPEQAQLTADAAKFILAGRMAEGSNATPKEIEWAVNLALGGRMTERNGTTFVLPPGVGAGDFSLRLRTYPAGEVASQLPDGKVYVRGQPMELQQFLNALPSAALVQAGRGRYAVQAGGTIATNSARVPVTITAERAPDLPRVEPGMIESGNIDLTNRPRVRNADGSISTVRSIGVNIDGQEILLPTVSDDGRIMSDEQAIAQYRKTGRHLGKFNSAAASDAYAQKLHQQQERLYAR